MADKHGRSCCCCLFGILWKILVALIVLVGLVFLIFWLVVQPRSFKFQVTEADLTQFDYYTNNHTLHYNMVLNFTARNPNKKLSIYYDKVEALAFYEDARFANYDVITHMNSFRQYKKSTSPMSRSPVRVFLSISLIRYRLGYVFCLNDIRLHSALVRLCGFRRRLWRL